MRELPQIVFLDVVGCPENRFDVAQLRSKLEHMGIKITENPSEADTLIVNTCGLTQGTENLSVEIIRKVRSLATPQSHIFITGCLPLIHKEALEEFSNVTIIPGPMTGDLPWKIETPIDESELFCGHIHPQRLTLGQTRSFTLRKSFLSNLDILLYKWINVSPPSPPTYSIKIATGCNLACTYCAVRLSRGRLASMPPDWVKARIEQGLDQGYKDFSLLGTNVSAYGRDLGISLPSLLNDIFQIDNSFRVRLRNVEPCEVIRYLPEFTKQLETGRISYVEFPLESGSNRILKLMQRGYTVEEYTRCLKEMKRAFPKLLVRSQIMAGFPTETDEDFKQSLNLLKTLPLDYVELYCFSARPGTKAAELEGHVKRKVARQRYESLRKTFVKGKPFKKCNLYLRHCLYPSLFRKKLRQRNLSEQEDTAL